jgi:glycosyltransferase involved in cell wall biosynthesis
VNERTSQPLLTIGLLVYNGEAFVESAIQSILAQTYTSFELLICDNGSIDGTEDICSRYAAIDERIQYHRHPKNLGAAPNFNFAFSNARGRYFKWADYDDIMTPTFLAECVDGMERHPEAAVCFTKARLIDERGEPLGDYDPLPDTSSNQPHIRFRNLLMAPDHFAIQASGVMRPEKLRQTVLHGSYPSSDEVLLASLALTGRFVELETRSFVVRVHRKQSTKGVLASERSRVLFADTSLEGQVVLIKWLYLRGCLAAIRLASLSYYQRVRCLGHVIRWAFLRKNSRSLVKDGLLAIHRYIPLFPSLHADALRAARRGNYGG